MSTNQLKEWLEPFLCDLRIESISIEDWKECGEFAGEDPRPIITIKKIPWNKTPEGTYPELKR